MESGNYVTRERDKLRGIVGEETKGHGQQSRGTAARWATSREDKRDKGRGVL